MSSSVVDGDCPAKPRHAINKVSHIAYPKITGKWKDFLHQLRVLEEDGYLTSPTVTMEGTVKLHGMHADIVFDLSSLAISIGVGHPIENGTKDDFSDGNDESLTQVMRKVVIADDTDDEQFMQTVTFQSRNRICLPTESSQGYPKNLAQFPQALKYLRDRILTRFTECNPNVCINHQVPLVIAGEWIGHKVQRDVGINSLSNRLVILGVSINELWQNDYDYADIEASKAGIYSLHRVPMFKVEWNTSDLTEHNPALVKMQRLADEVERECPYAKHFGVELPTPIPANNSTPGITTEPYSASIAPAIPPNCSDAATNTAHPPLKALTKRQPGRKAAAPTQTSAIAGEGIVWKPGLPAARSNPATWLKTKGPHAAGSGSNINHITTASIADTAYQRDTLDRACRRWVSEGRLAQGFEYLSEMEAGIGPKNGLRVFVDWVVGDVLVEEKHEIEALAERMAGGNGGTAAAKAENVLGKVKKKVGWIARERYLEFMREFA